MRYLTKATVPVDKKIDFVFERFKEIVMVEADRSRLYEVLSNLLRNATRFIDKTESKITIALNKEKQSDEKGGLKTMAVVSVRDNGIGIDPEILPRLFQKFAASQEYGATGLGLYISKSIVEAHGGKIWAESNSDGPGAVFTFTLPIKE